MRGVAMIGVAALVSACVAAPVDIEGGRGAPSLVALQQMCGAQTVDYGPYAQAVYSALFDAFVANRRRGISQEQFCGFQAALAQHFASAGTSRDPQVRNQWIAFLNDQRATAISWRAAVDPTLRAG